MDSLYIAVSEQLGQDGTDRDNVTEWEYEGNTIQLSQNEDGAVIKITK